MDDEGFEPACDCSIDYEEDVRNNPVIVEVVGECLIQTAMYVGDTELGRRLKNSEGVGLSDASGNPVYCTEVNRHHLAVFDKDRSNIVSIVDPRYYRLLATRCGCGQCV